MVVVVVVVVVAAAVNIYEGALHEARLDSRPRRARSNTRLARPASQPPATRPLSVPMFELVSTGGNFWSTRRRPFDVARHAAGQQAQQWHAEGTLRGGREYSLTSPVEPEQLPRFGHGGLHCRPSCCCGLPASPESLSSVGEAGLLRLILLLSHAGDHQQTGLCACLTHGQAGKKRQASLVCEASLSLG